MNNLDIDSISNRLSGISVTSTGVFTSFYQLLNEYFYGGNINQQDFFHRLHQLGIHPNMIHPQNYQSPLEIFLVYLENSSPFNIVDEVFTTNMLHYLNPIGNSAQTIITKLFSAFNGNTQEKWGDYLLKYALPVKAFVIMELSTIENLHQAFPEWDKINLRNNFHPEYVATRDKCISYLKYRVILFEHTAAGEELDPLIDTEEVFRDFIQNFWISKQYRIKMDAVGIFKEFNINPNQQFSGEYPLEIFISSVLSHSEYALWDGGYEIKKLMEEMIPQDPVRMTTLIQGLLSIIEGIPKGVQWDTFAKDQAIDTRFFIVTRLVDDIYLKPLIPDWDDYENSEWYEGYPGKRMASRGQCIRYLRYMEKTSYIYE